MTTVVGAERKEREESCGDRIIVFCMCVCVGVCVWVCACVLGEIAFPRPPAGPIYSLFRVRSVSATRCGPCTLGKPEWRDRNTF